MIATDPRRVVCMKWDGLYGAEHVNRLHAMVRRHLRGSLEFICFADQPAGLGAHVAYRPIQELMAACKDSNYSAWLKVGLLSDSVFGADRRPTLFLDLDVVVLDALDPLFEIDGTFRISRNWLPLRKRVMRRPPRIGNSSVFRWLPGEHQDVVDRYRRDQESAKSGYPTEQAFVSVAVGRALDFWPEPWVLSWKRHCIRPFPANLLVEPRQPTGCRIIVFHGQPKPEDVATGIRSGRISLRTPPCRWIEDNYFLETDSAANST